MTSTPSLPAPASLPRKLLWLALLVGTCIVYRGSYSKAVGSYERVGDFFQEWASAKNYWEGLPIYTPQIHTAWRYLKYKPDYESGVFVGINGHPPACVLLALPLAKLDYQTAFEIWTLLSIAAVAAATILVLRFETGTVWTWVALPLLTLVLSNPLVQHLLMGQLGALLLLLLVGMVWADDRDRPYTAGLLLGLATAFKVFPGLFFLYFATQRKWRTLLIGGLTLIGVNLLGLGVLGVQAYRHFFELSMPEVLRYRDWWTNYSVTGWWFKLFDAPSGQVIPFMQNALIARVGSLITVSLVMLLTALAAHRAGKNREARLSSLALFFVAVVLCAPVAWDHYFLLLLWPALRLGLRSPDDPSRWALRSAAFFTWLNPMVLHLLVTKPMQPTTALGTVLIDSIPLYAVLAVFALNLRLIFVEATVTAAERVDEPSAELSIAGRG
jgi:hypothetical protein